jgi:glutamate---cysteine ligase / carboxylate-amine ligase
MVPPWGMRVDVQTIERFDHAPDLTVGAEEELLLVDPVSFDLIPLAGELVDGLPDRARFRRELSASQIEIVTFPAVSSADVVEQLAGARRQLVQHAGGRARLIASGAHPFALPWSDISPGARYQTILNEHALAARLGGMAAGLHVHVAVSGGDRAVAVYDGLRGLMPLLIALSGNAPFFAGRDSGLATVRCMLSDALPRHGTGPWLRDWRAFEALVAWGHRSGAIRDTSQYWWDCRLNTRTGTVEVRAPDAQSSLSNAEALIAIVHAAVVDLCESHDSGRRPARHDVIAIDENRWRAARFGLQCELLDLAGDRMVPARELIAELLERIEPAARRVGGARGLDHARALLQCDLPESHRAIERRDGLRSLCAWLAHQTERPHGDDSEPLSSGI